ncbi:MAG TPA: HigA family addiction module antitoxin [Polyangiaceae bacterium]|nr:HigA family addiction module antitoxin [Polyangiaceae bacterium]
MRVRSRASSARLSLTRKRRHEEPNATYHPGEILREEYLVPLNLSANALAQVLGVPTNRISAIVAEKRAVTADTALRLARAFKTSPEFWLNLQQAFDLRTTERTVGSVVRGIKPIRRGHAA